MKSRGRRSRQSGGRAQPCQGIAQPLARFDERPRHLLIKSRVCLQVRGGTGKEAHTFDKRDAVVPDLLLNFLPMRQCLVELLAVHLHPLTAQQDESLCPAQQRLRLLGRKCLSTQSK